MSEAPADIGIPITPSARDRLRAAHAQRAAVYAERERLQVARRKAAEELMEWEDTVERLEAEVDQLRAAWSRYRVDRRLGIAGVEPGSEEALERELRAARLERDACREAVRLFDERLASPELERRTRQAEDRVKDEALEEVYATSPTAAHYREIRERFLEAQAHQNDMIAAGARERQIVHASPMAPVAVAARHGDVAYYRALVRDPEAQMLPASPVAATE